MLNIEQLLIYFHLHHPTRVYSSVSAPIRFLPVLPLPSSSPLPPHPMSVVRWELRWYAQRCSRALVTVTAAGSAAEELKKKRDGDKGATPASAIHLKCAQGLNFIAATRTPQEPRPYACHAGQGARRLHRFHLRSVDCAFCWCLSLLSCFPFINRWPSHHRSDAVRYISQ